MGATDWLIAGARVGDYVIERELAAKTGFIAWSAKHTLLPRRARITTVRPAFARAQSLVAQLTREACVLEVLRHGGVPRVYECGLLDDGRPWVASELIDGPRLSAILSEEGKLGVPLVLSLLAGVAEILHYAHTRGLVHRNLRPEAIASRPEGPCIVDWGDARTRDGDVQQLAPLDWLAYQPPEVVAGEPADSRADVYALGAIAHEALAGVKPPAALARRFPAVPERLMGLLGRMVALDALVRPTSAEVRAEALAIVEQIEVPVPPPGEEDGTEVQIEDVELLMELATEGDLESLPPPPTAMADGSLSFAQSEFDDRARTKTMPPAPSETPATLLEMARTKTEPMVAEHLARTKTDPMTAEHLGRTKTESMPAEHLGRTKTEPMIAEPDPRMPRTSTRMNKLAVPPGLPDRPRTKTP